MPRANRHHLPGHVWHITHRCHKQELLLKFARDRRLWRYWLYQARRRYGLCVLNYIVTSNHVHLLLRDEGRGEILRAMQLIAGRVGQAYNRRKGRKGAFWEDRYHATAVESGTHLARCLVYIDLNMVRAGVVQHPSDWEASGYREIQDPPDRYRVMDQQALLESLEMGSFSELRECHRMWVEEALASDRASRDDRWTTSVAVGSRPYVDEVQRALGIRSPGREVEQAGDTACVREDAASYAMDGRY
ncbi:MULTISPECIES: transposase [unclassified Thioalkalivibrio]|uniref:transposase n=1 Tax=unclassified Thioalkalivibrio TaxID=2621013 RepID=UPI00036B8CF0|nr:MULTISPECIES: transposase [unclassified Thioalkalivibrio]